MALLRSGTVFRLNSTVAHGAKRHHPRADLPDVAWVGDTELAPHALGFIGLGRVTAEIIFHAPIDPADWPDRKALARHCHSVISAAYRRLMRGHAPGEA